MDNKNVPLTDIELRIDNLIKSQDEVEKALYRSEAEESIQNSMM